MRISIIGQPGSGKTYVAEAISKKLGIPHIHLDRFWFEAGGVTVTQHTSEEERARVRAYVRHKTSEATQAESWVSDGFYSTGVGPDIAKQADVILFLDVPLWEGLIIRLTRLTGELIH